MGLTRAALDDLSSEHARAELKRFELDKLDLSKPWAVGNMTYEVKDFGVENGKLCLRLAVKKDDRRHFIGKPDTTIETIRIASPRTKVPTGKMLRDKDGNAYAEMTPNPVAALKFTLARRANRLIGDLIPDGLPEKIGRTEDLFYSAAGASDASGIDGFLRVSRSAGLTWAAAQGDTPLGDQALATQASWPYVTGIVGNDPNANLWCDSNAGHEKGYFGFLTGPTLTGRAVTASSFTFRGSAKTDALSITPKVYLAEATGWVGTSLTPATDRAALGAKLAEITYAAFDAAGDNVFTLTDTSAISTSGITPLCMILQHMFENTEPTYILGARSAFGGYFADDATYDPELAVSSEPAASGGMAAPVLVSAGVL